MFNLKEHVFFAFHICLLNVSTNRGLFVHNLSGIIGIIGEYSVCYDKDRICCVLCTNIDLILLQKTIFS